MLDEGKVESDLESRKYAGGPPMHNAEFRIQHGLTYQQGWWERREGVLYFPDMTKNFRARDEHIALYGFAVLSEDAVAVMGRYGPLLEIGCGGGYWAYELQRAGIDCIATDPNPVKSPGQNFSFSKAWVDIEPINALEALARHPGRTLLTVWPDYKGEWTGEAVAAYEGDHVIYVGEGHGGCTGDELFHRVLDERFELVSSVNIPQFYGIHDRLTIHRRIK